MIVQRRKRTLVIGSLVAVIAIAGIGMAMLLSQKPVYDFPLERTVRKEVEDVRSGTGSLPLKDFIKVAPGSPRSSSHGSSVPGGIAAAFAANDALPPHIRIEVPFTVQAPLGNWNLPFQEACEEASIIMVHHFLQGTTITPEQADKEIRDIVEWENGEFHYSADVTAEELKRIAEDYYHHTGHLFYEFTIDDMKRLLAHGYPVIVPLAGRDIGNPYYSGEGPWYHMLVLTGYDGDQFITNDVGTKRGKDFRYRQQVIYDAIHDWNQQKEDIHGGRKVILVLGK